jgi:hypothetical protein
MAIIDNLQKISDTILGITGELQGRYARAGTDHHQHEAYPPKRKDQ